ncbi:hypothetical protein G9A89_021470 [Geosiphon pyriformis]|nr:hypothetical protein G9A89_021470 [Geosiphon pyriformis]
MRQSKLGKELWTMMQTILNAKVAVRETVRPFNQRGQAYVMHVHVKEGKDCKGTPSTLAWGFVSAIIKKF